MNPESIPPPPPLPPSLPPVTVNQHTNNVEIEIETKLEFYNIVKRTQSVSYLKEAFYSFCSPIKPQLQDGPKCGLVALSIVSERNVDELFNIAKMKGFSKQGEMFSAEWLANLAEENFNTRIIENGLSSHTQCILHCLLNGGFVLIPYDADYNHSPCLKQGHKAHWAVVCGFVIYSSNFNDSVFLYDKNICKCLDNFKVKDIQVDVEGNNVIIKKLNGNSSDEVNEGKLFMAARHGKSCHLALWDFNDLNSSNFSLIEISPDRESKEFILPPGGVSQGLKGKAILLYPKEKSSS